MQGSEALTQLADAVGSVSRVTVGCGSLVFEFGEHLRTGHEGSLPPGQDGKPNTMGRGAQHG
ncbi:hypothetical protein ACFU96_45875 [Streptomyces sp. NPDC057620]|uniref:hypothetical protein n=1 Tax=Streptomyces sp. NPDC057620 TaxID=3346185 RepID=UPI0036CB29FE